MNTKVDTITQQHDSSFERCIDFMVLMLEKYADCVLGQTENIENNLGEE